MDKMVLMRSFKAAFSSGDNALCRKLLVDEMKLKLPEDQVGPVQKSIVVQAVAD